MESRALKAFPSIKICIIISLITFACVKSVATANEDNKSGSADSGSNFTYDQKDRDGLAPVPPFPSDNAAPLDNKGPEGGGNQHSNISTISNNLNGTKVEPPKETTTTTSTTTPAPLIPPAKVEASIAQMSSAGSKKKGQIIIRWELMEAKRE